MIDPLYSLSGFAVGLLVGMTGVGGGSLMTPILILLFGVHPAIRPGARQSDRGGLSRAWVNSIPSTARNTILVGIVLGTLVSISSVGAGALGVIALIMLYPRLPMAKIVGSERCR